MTFERVHLGDTVTLYRGDCLEVLPTLEAGSVDAVVTDPPYGVGYAEWDANPVMDWLDKTDAAIIAVTPGIKNLFAWPRPFWIASYSYPQGLKHAAGGRFNSWEPVLLYGGNPFQVDHKQFYGASESIYGHPSVKPLAPFRWIISNIADADSVVLDPFMGSGTTGVACVQTGRRFIGIEIDPTYFEIAVKRISDALKQPRLFDAPQAKPEQERML